MNIVFEYSARSIGGINTKAAMLDIMANLLLMGSATATFWGGQNRMMPGSGSGTAPFLGGRAGKAAWMRGDPAGFVKAVANQFEKAASAISDFLFAAVEDPFEALKSLAAGGASMFMKGSITSRGTAASGIRAILTGEPVGEWHLTVGNPMNPIMMIGNLICTNLKIEFNDELGPDDFPTEIKATFTLEHGMPRDRSAIESMFNFGGGRLYALPPGVEASMSSANQTAVDGPTGSNAATSNPNTSTTKGSPNQTGSQSSGSPSNSRLRGVVGRSILFGDPSDVDKSINIVKRTASKVSSNFAATWGSGFGASTPNEQPPAKK
jgi:hypothetical protein